MESSTGFENDRRPDLCKVWLNETKLVMLLVSIPLIWQYIGYYMVIILSAISSISTEIFESAEIDGATVYRAHSTLHCR